MPLAYVNKQAKRHHTTLRKAEGKWRKAKRIAAREGHQGDYAYITGIFKKMI